MTPISRTPNKYRVNREIRAREVRLIGADGNQVGVIPLKEALTQAEEGGLDLVEINPTSRPPIAKMMDYGKYRYEQSKKEREARQKRKTMELREVKFRPKIDIHDYETKKKTVLRLLKDGNKVKITMMFRGREMAYRKQGADMLKKLSEEIVENCTVERAPKSEGRTVTMILVPKFKS